MALTTIESGKVDANYADIVQDLNNLTNGTNFWTGPIKAAVGTALLPGYTFNGDPNTGMYWIGADNIGWSVNGAIELDLNATRLAPGADDGLALGSSSRQWSDVFLAPGRVIRWNNTDVTITHSTDSLFFAGATNGYAFDQAVVIASGKALSFDNGDVTLTHSANNLTLAGGEFTLPNTGLHLLDTNATHDLIIAPGSNLTADRTLTITTGDAAHTLDISGAPTSVVIATGTYTPTLTNTTNVAASTAAVCNYMRVGDMVTVSGSVAIDPTTGAILTTMEMSLPIASDIGTISDLGGAGAGATSANEAWGIFGNAASNVATFQCICTNTNNHNVLFSFMYRVI